MTFALGDRVIAARWSSINTPPGVVVRVGNDGRPLSICVRWTTTATRLDIWYSEGDLIKVDNGLDIMLGII